MAEGDELPPVVAALVGDDSSFLEMIARDVEAAEQFKADMQAALGEGVEVAGPTLEGGEGTEAIVEETQAALAEAQEAVAEASGRIAESLTEAGTAGGEGLAEGVMSAAAEAGARVDELMAQMRALTQEGTEEAQAAAAALQPAIDEATAAWQKAEREGFGYGETVEEAASKSTAAGAEIVASTTAITEATEVATAAAESFETSFDAAYAAVASGSISADVAMRALAGDGDDSVTRVSGALAQMRSSWILAQESMEQAGTSEAQLAVNAAALTQAQGLLADANTSLTLSFQQISDGADVAYAELAGVLGTVADAQQRVTDLTQAQVSAMTELNLAAVQGTVSFYDETAALDGVRAASIQLGIGLGDVATELEAGSFAATSAAGAQAQAAIEARLLTEAEQQLAAANLTLVQTYQQLDIGIEVSAETQRAALAGVKAAQSQVTSLGGSLSGAADEADGVAGSLGEVEKAASGAEHGMGGLAGMMYGPLGMALYPLMTVLPMLGSAFTDSAASAATFTSAVSQDSGAVGDNTAATIQTALAKTNLLGISQKMGISQAELIEYAAGESQAQQQVAAAYNAAGQAIAKNASSQAESGYATKNGVDQTQRQTDALQNEKTILDQVTASVQQAVQQDQANSAALLAAEQSTQIYNASVNALGVSMQTQVEQTQMSNQATVEYGARLEAAESSTQYMNAAVGAAGVNMMLQSQATEVTNEATVQYGDAVMGAYRDTTMFTAAVDASYISMQEQAQTAAISSVGLLNLGDSQTSLNMQLVASEQSYTAAQQGATAYGTAVASLSGSFSTLYGDEASFTGALASLTSSLKTNGDSLDANSAKGYQNAQAAQAVANAAIQAATATYQNAKQTETSMQAWNTANAYLGTEKTAFEQAAIAAGGNKTAVDQLADSLFELPKNITSTVTVNTAAAQSALSQLYSEMSQLESQGVSVAQQEVTAVKLGAASHRASGGPVQAGRLYNVNEKGQEGYFVPPANGYIVPHDAMSALSSGVGGGSSTSGGGGSGGVTVHVYLDSREITASVRTEAQQYKTRNSQTGLT